MRRLQCARPGCGHVWDCVAQLQAIDAASPDGALTDLSLAPRCLRCGHEVYRPSLRGGDWFDPAPYAEAAGDTHDLTLDAADAALIDALHDPAGARKLVCVLLCGRPLAPPARVRPSMSTHATPRWLSQ